MYCSGVNFCFWLFAGCRLWQDQSCQSRNLCNLCLHGCLGLYLCHCLPCFTQMCISARLRTSAILGSQEVLTQLLRVPARTATGWNAGLRTNCLSNFAILVSLVNIWHSGIYSICANGFIGSDSNGLLSMVFYTFPQF